MYFMLLCINLSFIQPEIVVCMIQAGCFPRNSRIYSTELNGSCSSATLSDILSSDLGSLPKRFSPSVPFWHRNINSTMSPMMGIKINKTHHPERSVSCNRLTVMDIISKGCMILHINLTISLSTPPRSTAAASGSIINKTTPKR